MSRRQTTNRPLKNNSSTSVPCVSEQRSSLRATFPITCKGKYPARIRRPPVTVCCPRKPRLRKCQTRRRHTKYYSSTPPDRSRLNKSRKQSESAMDRLSKLYAAASRRTAHSFHIVAHVHMCACITYSRRRHKISHPNFVRVGWWTTSKDSASQ